MSKNQLFDRYLTLVEQEGLVSSQGNWRFYLDYLFSGISFDAKATLDIGGGRGLFSFYAACMAADDVVCLEPDAAGSRSGNSEIFEKLRSELGMLDRVRLEPSTIQDFEGSDGTFDILLLHNSVNHLDEESCIRLQCDDCAVEAYKKIFKKLSKLGSRKAKLIATDCSRYNVFALLHLKNPFSPTIEWHKHQSPWYWAELLSEAGFRNPKIRWASFSRLRSPGKLLLGNRFASYLLHSQFCLTMEKGT